MKRVFSGACLVLMLACLLVSGRASAVGWWNFFFPAEDAPEKGSEAELNPSLEQQQLIERMRELAYSTMNLEAEQRLAVQAEMWAELREFNEPDRDLSAGIERFVKEGLNLKLDSVIIERYLNPGDVSEGVSEDPLFFVKREGGGLVAVIKAFLAAPPNLRGFSAELTALAVLERLELREGAVISVLGVGRLSGGSEEYALMAMTAAPGVSVTRLIKNVGAELPGSRARGDHMADLRKATNALGRALAEVHTARALEGGEIAEIFWKIDDQWIERFLLELERTPSLTRIPASAFLDAYHFLRDEVRPHRHLASYVHSDAHTGNYLYDPKSDVLTVIDIQRFMRSIGQGGVPQGPREYDYVWILCFIDGCGSYYGLTEEERQEAKRMFSTAYCRSPGVPQFCEQCLAYHTYVFWASTVAAYRRPSAGYTEEMRQQMQAFINLSLTELEAATQKILAQELEIST